MSCRDTDFQAGDPYEVVCMYVGCLRRWIGPGSLQFKTNAVSLAFRFTLVMYVCITKVLEEEGQKDAFNLQELCAVSIDFQQASRCPNLFQTSDVCNFGGSAVHRCWWSKCFSESRDDLRDLHGRVCVVLNVGFEMERTKAPPKMWMKSWIEVEQMFLHSLWIPDWSATYRLTELHWKVQSYQKEIAGRTCRIFWRAWEVRHAPVWFFMRTMLIMGVSAATDILVLSGVSLSLAGKARTSQCDPSLPEPGEESVCQGQSWAPLGLPEAWGGLVSNAWLARRQLQEFKQCNSLVVWHRLPLQRLRTVTTILCWGVECKQHAKSIGCVVSDGGPWGQATQLPPLDRQQRPKLRWYKCHHFRSPKVSPKWFHVWKVIDKLGVSWGYHEIAGPLSFLPASRAKLRGAPVPKCLWFMTHDGCSLRRTRGRGSGGPPSPREGSQQKFKAREMWLLQSVSALDWSISPIFHFGVTWMNNGTFTGKTQGPRWWHHQWFCWLPRMEQWVFTTVGILKSLPRLETTLNRCLGWQQRWSWFACAATSIRTTKGIRSRPGWLGKGPWWRPRFARLFCPAWNSQIIFMVKIGSKLRPSWGGCGSKLRPNFGLSLHVLTV